MVKNSSSADYEKLIDSLLSKTSSGDVTWESVEDLENLYEARLNRGRVRVSHAVVNSTAMSGDEIPLDIFDLVLLDHNDRVKQRISTGTGWPGRGDAEFFSDSERLAELFRHAKESAENPREFVSDLLNELMS